MTIKNTVSRLIENFKRNLLIVLFGIIRFSSNIFW